MHLRRSTLVVLVMTVLCGIAFRCWTELGTHVWNLRLISFWYFGVHLLIAIGVAELIRGAGWLGSRGWWLAQEWRAERAAEAADAESDGYGGYDEYGALGYGALEAAPATGTAVAAPDPVAAASWVDRALHRPTRAETVGSAAPRSW